MVTLPVNPDTHCAVPELTVAPAFILPTQAPLLEPTLLAPMHQVVAVVISMLVGLLLYMPMAVNWALDFAAVGLTLTD